ncbi:hypothetical protein SAMN05443246_4629 [Paenibacillus sp. GP183]|nr:hypothetical protein SAMN05443246_4629 [Paenibacillus sp. GP183]
MGGFATKLNVSKSLLANQDLIPRPAIYGFKTLKDKCIYQYDGPLIKIVRGSLA